MDFSVGKDLGGNLYLFSEVPCELCDWVLNLYRTMLPNSLGFIGQNKYGSYMTHFLKEEFFHKGSKRLILFFGWWGEMFYSKSIVKTLN